MPTIKDSELLFLEVISANGDKNGINISEFFGYEIVNVFLPDELLPEHRKSITELKESVYTHPDLYLEIKNEDSVYFQSVEIKSTKQNNIRGSSIQQVSPFEWVVFIKRGKEIEVSTGFYINSVTEKLPFPDRSPRPQVGFNTLKNWNKKHRISEKGTLRIIEDEESIQQKMKLLIDWQDYLAEEWLEIIKSAAFKSNEKWFNMAIRKFALKFLDYTEELSEDEKIRIETKACFNYKEVERSC